MTATPAITGRLAWSAASECCNRLIQAVSFSFQVRNDTLGVQGSVAPFQIVDNEHYNLGDHLKAAM
jgi:hypothetical protein